MFGDYVKMAAKGIALGVGVAIIIGFVTGFAIPVINIDFISSYMNKAYTIGVHYIPFFAVLWTLGTTLITLDIVLYGIKLALIGVRWVLKVNE